MDSHVALYDDQDNPNSVVPVELTTRLFSEDTSATSTHDYIPPNSSFYDDLFEDINDQFWEIQNAYFQEPLPEHPTLWIADELPVLNVDERNPAASIPLYTPAEPPVASASSSLQIEEGHVSPFPNFNFSPPYTDSFPVSWDLLLGHQDANEDQYSRITTGVAQDSPSTHVNNQQPSFEVDYDSYRKRLERLDLDQLIEHFLSGVPMYPQPDKSTAYTQVNFQESFINYTSSAPYEEGAEASLELLPNLSNEPLEAQTELTAAHLQPTSTPATDPVADIPTAEPTEGTSSQTPSPAKAPSAVGSSPSLSDAAVPREVNGLALPWAVPPTDAPFIFKGNSNRRAEKRERECPWCCKKFVTTQAVATRHVNSCQNNPNRVLWQCDICQKQYCRVDVRTTHMQRQHPREYQLMKQRKSFQRYAQAWAEIYL